MRKKILSILLSAVVATAMIPAGFAFADSGSEDGLDFIVNGVPVSDANCDDVLDDGTVSYDSATNTLTLDGADINDDNHKYAGIYYSQASEDEPLTINVKSDSKITSTEGIGIYVESLNTDAQVTVTGNGKLAIESSVDDGTLISSDIFINKGNIAANSTSRAYCAIYAAKTFTNSGSLSITGCDSGIRTGSFVQDSGTMDVSYRNTGMDCNGFDISGGTINFSSTHEDGLGIFSDLEGEPGVFNFSGGKLNIKDGFSGMQLNGGFNITGGTISIETEALGILLLGKYNIKDGDITIKVSGESDFGEYATLLKAVDDSVFEELVPGTDYAADMKIAVSKNVDGSNLETFKAADYMNVYKYMHIYKPANIALKSLSLSKTSYYCTGKSQGPVLTVKDVNGKTVSSANYTVSGTKKAVKPGTYKVTVKGKGNYTGTFSKSYKIKVKPTKIVSLAKGTKSFTVKASKLTSTYSSGYQVRYSLKKSMSSAKTVTISSKSSAVKKTVKNLKKGKTYYVQVRNIKKVDGKKYYSAWSDKKSVKTK